jgi:hypothetical protein
MLMATHHLFKNEHRYHGTVYLCTRFYSFSIIIEIKSKLSESTTGTIKSNSKSQPDKLG